MIINCGRRRIVRDRYGYTIEYRHVRQSGKKAGEAHWKIDRPGHPATLSDALTVVYERTLADENEELDVLDLPTACQHAAETLKNHLREFRRAGVKQAAKEVRHDEAK